MCPVRSLEPVTAPEPKPKGGRLPLGFATLRDVLTFMVGMVIIGYEVFVSAKVDAAVLAVGLTMTGLPLVFGADERRKGGAE